jgi:uncharacterized heparinase superfamily protein
VNLLDPRSGSPGQDGDEQRGKFRSDGQMALSFADGEHEEDAKTDGAAVLPISQLSDPAEPGSATKAPEFEAPSVSAAEWATRNLYRAGVPAHALVAPFRKPPPLRLKAAVENPLPGDRVSGMALRAGHFLICGTKLPIEQADLSPAARLAPAVEATLHGFTWLRDLATCAPPQQCADVAELLLEAWLVAGAEIGKGPAWKVENAGRRLLAWLVHAPLIMAGSNKAVHRQMLEEMEQTARWLDRNVRKAEDGHGEALGWAAITAAGLLLPDGKPRRLYGEEGLFRALGDMVGEDGGVLSRAPAAQMEAIAMLVDLAACYRALRSEPPRALAAMLHMLAPPLLAVAHADGSLGNWQGAGSIAAERVNALLAASGARGRPLYDGRQWGYQRITARGSVLVCDAAPPPLPRNARSGCASTLAFEFSHGEHLLIVNCGGAALVGGQVPRGIEQGLRATAAHSTLVLGDANSTAVLINGKLGEGVTAVEVDRRPETLEAGGTATRLELEHDGYASRFGLIHRRVLTLRDDGEDLIGQDELAPAPRKAKRGKVSYAVRFHLGPHVDARLTEDGCSVDLLLPGGVDWRFDASGHAITIEESIWVDGEGRPHPVQQLVLEGLASRAGDCFDWRLSRIV